jgi:hypothetical protein
MRHFPEERLADLLRLLPPPPVGWIRAAQELPRARRGLDDLVERARADADFRRALLADLEAAFAQAGIEPQARMLNDVRARLEEL